MLAERLIDDGFVIFLFHGVVEHHQPGVRNYTRKHIDVSRFASLLGDLVDAGGRPISMDDVVAAHSGGEHLPRRAFAVTFDDGFANNYTVAAPVLADMAIPATFYVTTGFVEGNTMSWIDRIEWCLDATPSATVRLPWELEPVGFRTDEEKIRLLDSIRGRVKTDVAIDVDSLVADLFADCGIDEVRSGSGPLDLKLSWDEVRALAEHDLFTVGGHTHTHRILSFLSSTDRRSEIQGSLRALGDHLGSTPEHFSYPEGLAHCFDDDVISDLVEAGVVCSPTAIDGVNDESTGLFHLRRVAVV